MTRMKLFAVLALCMTVSALAQIQVDSPAVVQRLIAACGVPGALAVKASGDACRNSIVPASVKVCPAPCKKLLAGVPKTPACAAALKAMTPAAVNAKVGKVSFALVACVRPSVPSTTTGQLNSPSTFRARHAALPGLRLALLLANTRPTSPSFDLH
jgi:hypothetical protein